MDITWLYFGLAGLLAGAINSLAGGGSFLTFPALILGGLSPLTANQTSSVALLPGALSGSWGYRRQLHGFKALSLAAMTAPTVVGGGAGALLLLFTPSKVFDLVIPWLVMFGALVFAFGKQFVSGSPRSIGLTDAAHSISTWLIVTQFAWGVYGGYFGGAVGIMMMATWTVLGIEDVQAMNAMKVMMLAASKLVAVLVFAFLGTVNWPAAAVMSVATIIGGYFGAHAAQKINPRRLRQVITVGFFVIAAAFFLRSYGTFLTT